MNIKTLIIEITNRSKKSIKYRDLILYLKKIYPDNIVIKTGSFNTLRIIKYLNISSFVDFLKLIFFILNKIISLKSIINCKNEYYRTLRNCIVDQIERETGYLTTKPNSEKYIYKNFIDFLLKGIKLQVTLSIIELIIKEKGIEAIFIDQLDGFPYSGITALAIIKNIYIGTSEANQKKIFLRKGFLYEWLPLEKDLQDIYRLNLKSRNERLENYKRAYLSDKENSLSPFDVKKFISNEILINKYKFDKNKKNAVVLLHHFTDQSRMRLQYTWYESFLDWFLETIEYCSLNKNINWFFKPHPIEKYYPIDIHIQKSILDKIKNNNFLYINPENNLSHEDLAQFASVLVTCNGTCKIEYPTLFNIPVISCISDYLVYDSSIYSHTAKTNSEYKKLILNAHKLTLSSKDIDLYKVGFLAYKNVLEASINDQFELKELIDKKGNKVFRNF